jgi:mannose-1-phosphate guanylyltransferase
MGQRMETWVVVLAGGDGTRLSALTKTDAGDSIPKQFCSLDGGPQLLEEALQRAQRIVPRERVCAIVARQHERHWIPVVSALPPCNVIVEPRNRGTANGVLHGLLSVLELDPAARTVFLPSDHFVRDEDTLASSVRAVAERVATDLTTVTLVGIQPDDVDPELGYILPGAPLGCDISRVARFVEKPDPERARDLILRGAVWNSFIFAAHGTRLLQLIQRRVPEIVAQMKAALAQDHGRSSAAVDRLYGRLPVLDFSRDIVEGAEEALALSTAPACGWTDLGTVRRVASALQRLENAIERKSRAASTVAAIVDLRTRYQRFRLSA